LTSRALATIPLALAFAACAEGRATDRELNDLRALRGELVHAELDASVPRGRYVTQRIRLASSAGVLARGILTRPTNDTGCFPAALLEDGREENSGVSRRLPADFGDIVVLSLDYPDEIPYTIRLRDAALHGGPLERASRRVPAIFSLGAAYLAQRDDVDSTRIALAATSFAVPFAAIAAAMDERFRNVVFVYGAGDLPSVLAANLRDVPEAMRRPAAALAMQPFAALAPERFVDRIAPRPLVMVNGVDDPQMPVEAVRRLYDAAREPKSLVWLRTGHLMPTDSLLIRALIDTAFARLPVLRDTTSAPRCRRSAPTAGP
jgi:fermentation-respiration switch protein FrsA (DUF1100 family)